MKHRSENCLPKSQPSTAFELQMVFQDISSWYILVFKAIYSLVTYGFLCLPRTITEFDKTQKIGTNGSIGSGIKFLI